MKYPKFSISLLLFLPFALLSQVTNDALVEDGLKYNQEGKYEKAIDAFTLYIKSENNPKVVTYRHRGYSYLYMNKYSLAIMDFQKAEELAPGKTDALFALGKIAYKTGDFPKALAYFNQEISYHPNNSRALNDRGIVKCQVRDYDAAFDDFLEATEIDSTFAMAYNNAGTALYYNQDVDNPIMADISTAKNYFSKAIEMDPTLSVAYRNRGTMKLFLDMYDEALIDLNIAGKLEPKEAIIPFCKGIALEKKGKPMAAVKELEKAIAINDNFLYAYEEIGDIYKEKEQFGKALSYYKKAISRTNTNQGTYKGLIYYKMAIVHASEGETSKMYQKLWIAKKFDAFKDKKVYQNFLQAKELRKYRNEKKLRKFTKSITKLKKENKFLHSELRWFRMND